MTYNFLSKKERQLRWRWSILLEMHQLVNIDFPKERASVFGHSMLVAKMGVNVSMAFLLIYLVLPDFFAVPFEVTIAPIVFFMAYVLWFVKTQSPSQRLGEKISQYIRVGSSYDDEFFLEHFTVIDPDSNPKRRAKTDDIDFSLFAQWLDNESKIVESELEKSVFGEKK
jgi:hypothetical protein